MHPASGAGDSPELSRRLTLADGVGSGVLHVSAQAASCDDDPATEHPVCYLGRQDWGLPVHVASDGVGELRLVLLG